MMDEHRKNAYRLLLYHAMLEMRGVEWITHQPLRLLNPLVMRRELRRASRAGAIANWLHNLAQLSACDFRDFNEEWFWRDYDRLLARHPGGWMNYREEFNRAIAELDAAASAK